MAKPQYDSVTKFTEIQNSLLQLERQEEIDRTKDLLLSSDSEKFSFKKAQELEKKGLGFRKVAILEWTTSAFGKNLITIGKQDQSELSASTFSNGDIIGLYNESLPSNHITGVVCSISSKSITISIDDSFEDLDQESTYFVVKLANDITYKRLKSAIQAVSDSKGFSTLHNFLFGLSDLGVPHQNVNPKLRLTDADDSSGEQEGQIHFTNPHLNESQREAIEFALKQKELAVIHGPPGTGKTTTLVEYISLEVKQGSKVLCCAPSNVAVDNLLEKLAKNKIKVIRIGHPARVQAELQKYSLDAILSQSEQKILAQDVKADMDKALSKLKKTRSKNERYSLKSEMKKLRKELSDRENRAMKETLSKAEVVLVTLTSASNIDGPLKHLPDKHFNVAVIDECSQALEIACWLALIQSPKAVLAGDHLQLPPTIMSENAARKGLAFTLMERVISKTKEDFDGKQQDDQVSSNENTEIPLLLIDTTGCDMFELVTEDELSKANEGEAALVTMYVEELIGSGLDPSEIAVITPYNLQVEFIRMQLRDKYPNLEIKSVDGFQGREKEAVILSLVRCNPKGEVGFLAEARRLNVAITRAKRQVVVIANVETVSHDEVLKGLMDYLEQNGEVRSAMQYEHILRDIDMARPENMELIIKDSLNDKNQKSSEDKNNIKKKKNAAKKLEPKLHEPDQQPQQKQQPQDHHQKRPKNNQNKLQKDSIVPTTTDDDNNESRQQKQKEKLQKIIDDFVKDGSKKELHCSSELTSYERMVLHELANIAQLSHASEGEGKIRHIVLRKNSFQTSKETAEEVEEEEGRGSRKETLKKPGCTSIVLCSTCSKQVPKSNIELHKLKCTLELTPLAASTSKLTVLETKSTGAINKKNTSKKLGKKKKNESKDEEDDIDKLLAAFDKVDNVCNGEGCKAKIATLGVTCQHCRRRFCIGHGLPEAHGCGEAAKKAARQQLARDGQLYPGSGRPNFKPDPARKAALQRKLDKKVGELQESRKKNKPEEGREKNSKR